MVQGRKRRRTSKFGLGGIFRLKRSRNKRREVYFWVVVHFMTWEEETEEDDIVLLGMVCFGKD